MAPRPHRPLDLWLGGRLPVGMRRVGRLADGWLGSYLTPAEATTCRAEIVTAAERAGRTIDEDHYGTNLVVATDEHDWDTVVAAAAARRKDLADPGQLVCRGWAAAQEQVRRFVEAGLTKFVVRPAGPVTSRALFLDGFVAELAPLQT